MTTPFIAPGGKAIEYFSSMRVWLTKRKAKAAYVTDDTGLRIGSEVKVKIEPEGQGNAVFLTRQMPKISDAFVRDLYAFIPRMLKTKKRIDVLILKQRLQVVGERLMGKGLIKDILVQSEIGTPAG